MHRRYAYIYACIMEMWICDDILCNILFSFFPKNVEKVGYLIELKGAQNRLKLMKADLMVDGSFDQAVDGVDGVFHVASPVVVPYDNNIEANSPSNSINF